MSSVDLRPLKTAPRTIYSGDAIPDALAKAIEEQQGRALQLYGLLQALEVAVENPDRVRDLDAAMGAAAECANALYQLLDVGALEKRAKEIAEEQAAESEEGEGE